MTGDKGAMTDRDAAVLVDGLNRLRRSHYECGDCWYSCPKSEGGCCNDAESGCTCGADEHNAIIDSLLAHVRGGDSDLPPTNGWWEATESATVQCTRCGTKVTLPPDPDRRGYVLLEPVTGWEISLKGNQWERLCPTCVANDGGSNGTS